MEWAMSSIQMKTAAEVVFISTPGVGNLVPLVEFAHHLTTHHQHLSATILITTFPQRPIVDSYVNSRASTSSSQRVRFVHLPPPVDPPSHDQYQSSFAFISLFIEKHKPQVKHAITNLASTSNGSDLKIAGFFVDMFCASMIDVAKELGIPCYLYFASPATFLSFMLHLPALHAQVATDFLESGSEFIIPGFSNPVPPQVFPPLVLNRNTDGYSWFLHHARRYREAKGIIINTFQELEPYALNNSFIGDDIPPVYPIGPIIDHHGPAQCLSNSGGYEGIMKWLDEQPASSVVFLCFGSMGSLSEDQVKEIATGLERTGYRFLWSIRQPPKIELHLPNDYADLNEILPNGFLERTEGTGLVCGWVPQVTILAHQAIGGFVSHCGWNSILESLWYGVPIGTWPIYAEQQLNAFEMVNELGLAIKIRLDYRMGSDLVLAEEVERAVRRLMDGDGEVRIKVKQASERSKKALMEGGSSFSSLEGLFRELLY